jgi:hypothetical protein
MILNVSRGGGREVGCDVVWRGVMYITLRPRELVVKMHVAV